MKRGAGRVALVTGASRGIGAAIAEALAAPGLDLLLTSTTRTGCAATARRCEARGSRVVTTTWRAGDAASADALIRLAERRLGPVDVLINNAGTVLRRRVVEMRDRDFEDVVRANLFGPFQLIRRVLPGMVQRRAGRIVNLSSISATLGTPGATGYNASKWGLDGLMKSLAEEVRGTGVVVASVLPGSVDTDMLKGSGFAPAMRPQDVAAVVRFLALEAPAAVQGGRFEVFG